MTKAETKQIATTESAQLIDMVGRLASDPNADIDKMKCIIEMRNAENMRVAEEAFNRDLALAQTEIPQIIKRNENKFTRSWYAGLDDIDAAAKPIITKYGFGLSFGTTDCPIQGWFRVVCKVSHRDGFSRDYHIDIPSDNAGAKGTANKSPLQGFGSSMTYARRYLKCLIFDITTSDDNDGNRSGKPLTRTVSDPLSDDIPQAGPTKEPPECIPTQEEIDADNFLKQDIELIESMNDLRTLGDWFKETAPAYKGDEHAKLKAAYSAQADKIIKEQASPAARTIEKELRAHTSIKDLDADWDTIKTSSDYGDMPFVDRQCIVRAHLQTKESLTTGMAS